MRRLWPRPRKLLVFKLWVMAASSLRKALVVIVQGVRT
jgi:hypothetical protein